MEITPIPKPKKKKKNQGHKDWINFRTEFLKDKRDHAGYLRCEWCGTRNKGMDVDHIEKRSLRPDLVLVASNLRILCRPCHRRRHLNDPT